VCSPSCSGSIGRRGKVSLSPTWPAVAQGPGHDSMTRFVISSASAKSFAAIACKSASCLDSPSASVVKSVAPLLGLPSSISFSTPSGRNGGNRRMTVINRSLLHLTAAICGLLLVLTAASAAS
jgi:hypothetical protein